MSERRETPQEKHARLQAQREEKSEPPLIEPMEDDEPYAPPAPVIAADEEDTRRHRLLAGLDPEIAAQFTDSEIEEIWKAEEARAIAAKKKAAMETIRARAAMQAKADHGLISGDVIRSDEEQRRLGEPVRIRVNLPSDGAGHADHGFRIDQKIYRQGGEYTVTRAEFETLQEIHFRAWLAELKFSLLDQQKRGRSAIEVLQRTLPQLEVMH